MVRAMIMCLPNGLAARNLLAFATTADPPTLVATRPQPREKGTLGEGVGEDGEGGVCGTGTIYLCQWASVMDVVIVVVYVDLLCGTDDIDSMDHTYLVPVSEETYIYISRESWAAYLAANPGCKV